MMITVVVVIVVAAFTGVSEARPPPSPVRGVNLGGHFVMEPAMQVAQWAAMGCGSAGSEYDCVQHLGQDAADAAFRRHWDTWITESDILAIKSAGLNTVRIPVGFWLNEALVDRAAEHYPRGAFDPYFRRLCGWASTAGLYIIVDLHGAPSAQTADQAFTGRIVSAPGFFTAREFERAYKFLEWIAESVHSDARFSGVGAIELLNEPDRGAAYKPLLTQFYRNAASRIRATEDRLGVSEDSRLHIQIMDRTWSGIADTDSIVSEDTRPFAFFDNHRYLKWMSPPISSSWSAYIAAACRRGLSSGSDRPVVVGEWSIATNEAADKVAGFGIGQADAVEWYRRLWAAQAQSYESQFAGWIFWTWKVDSGRNGVTDWRWSYQEALRVGVIPSDPSTAAEIYRCP